VSVSVTFGTFGIFLNFLYNINRTTGTTINYLLKLGQLCDRCHDMSEQCLLGKLCASQSHQILACIEIIQVERRIPTIGAYQNVCGICLLFWGRPLIDWNNNSVIRLLDFWLDIWLCETHRIKRHVRDNKIFSTFYGHFLWTRYSRWLYICTGMFLDGNMHENRNSVFEFDPITIFAQSFHYWKLGHYGNPH